MKQLNIFSKLIIYIVSIFLLTACSSIDVNDKTINTENIAETTSINGKNNDTTYNYSISFMDTSEMMDLSWANDLSFNIVQVQDMPEKNSHLQTTINESIKTAMTSWIEGKILNPDSVDLTVTCHSSRYLSLVNSFMYESKKIDVINDYITIDMLTGQRVFLNDLVNIDEEFVKYLQEDNYKIKEPPNPMWQTAPDLNDYSPYELLEELNKYSHTQEYLIQNGYYSIDDSIGSLLFRNSFFLREGKLVITLEYGGEKFITFDVDDLDHFLKVDKW